jgi:hypothetical protein
MSGNELFVFNKSSYGDDNDQHNDYGSGEFDVGVQNLFNDEDEGRDC